MLAILFFLNLFKIADLLIIPAFGPWSHKSQLFFEKSVMISPKV